MSREPRCSLKHPASRIAAVTGVPRSTLSMTFAWISKNVCVNFVSIVRDNVGTVIAMEESFHLSLFEFLKSFSSSLHPTHHPLQEPNDPIPEVPHQLLSKLCPLLSEASHGMRHGLQQK